MKSVAYASCLALGLVVVGCSSGDDTKNNNNNNTATWACEASEQDDSYCDCGCGTADPACDGAGCTEPGCTADACEFCRDADGELVSCGGGGGDNAPEGWLCLPGWYEDGYCDCGCGVFDDIDCGGQVGCDAPGACADAACEYCYDDTQSMISCVPPPEGWTCDGLAYSDGYSCDCGCGITDPDCEGASCTAPGACAEAACDYCYDATGTDTICVPPPEGWACEPSYYGDGDCDCGCGLIDTGCTAAGGGCAEPSCGQTACEFCYDATGASITCPAAG